MSLYFFKTKICLHIFLFLFISNALDLTNGENLDEVDNSIRITQSLEFDEILNWEPPYELKKNLPYFLSGFDTDGCPIWISEVGKWDVRGQIETFGVETVQKYVSQIYLTFHTSAEREWKQEFELLAGNNQTKKGECENFGYSGIVDFDGFSSRQFASPPTVAMFVNLARFVFPVEMGNPRIKTIFGVNFNYLGHALYSFVSPFIGSIMNKVTILGTNSDRWKPKLLKAFPKSALPSWMGGLPDFKPLRVYG